ncbi:hypothetical protein N658DRAFT_129071 [Parathielavia hyrcaniae]|uniref:Uncharacterized protein n=1 Tax=Parathielavia hyrcaniae TaxID=113614 RepID=A0AAN6QCG5_9PEZI|nr:hypothetical protein N658DRAFT_129071 [Parathielavia hyrcaniae]
MADPNIEVDPPFLAGLMAKGHAGRDGSMASTNKRKLGFQPPSLTLVDAYCAERTLFWTLGISGCDVLSGASQAFGEKASQSGGYRRPNSPSRVQFREDISLVGWLSPLSMPGICVCAAVSASTRLLATTWAALARNPANTTRTTHRSNHSGQSKAAPTWFCKRI